MRTSLHLRIGLLAALTVGSLTWTEPACAFQKVEVAAPAPAPSSAPVAAPGAMPAGMRPGHPGGPGAPGGPPQPGKPGEVKPGDAKPGDAKPGDATPPAAETVKRPTTPKTPADPKELLVKPNAEGKVSFSFKGQPWPAVLEWLADVSNMSLHWEEAPPGYLDLTTRGSYSLDEVRDLINSVLLAKGFTLLRNGEILIVANLKTLDVALVPRVKQSELEKRGTYELVRCFFELKTVMADEVAEELKPIMSPFAKIVPMKTSNRLDIMDTAGNLRRIREMLDEEQSSQTQQRLLREFPLVYARAENVQETLNALLGIKTNNGPALPTNPQQMMQQQQAMMQAQQQAMQQQAQAGAAAAAAAKKELPIYIAINVRKNSVIVNAAADKIALVEQAIKALDVPGSAEGGISSSLPRFQVYRLTGVAPDALVKVLQELGGLSPTTRLEVDAKNKAIIAYAPLVDQYIIQSVVNKIDGSGRHFEVVQLRTLNAEYVAGSIELLMKGPEPKENNRRPPWYYDSFGGGSNNQDKDSGDKFTVEADTEFNRLLLRANDVEMAELHELLIKLGEIPPGTRNLSTRRVIAVTPGEETDVLIERLKKLWPTVSPSELEIDPSLITPAKPTKPTKPTDPRSSKPAAVPSADKPTRSAHDASHGTSALLAALLHEPDSKAAEATEPDATEPAAKKEPSVEPAKAQPADAQPAKVQPTEKAIDPKAAPPQSPEPSDAPPAKADENPAKTNDPTDAHKNPAPKLHDISIDLLPRGIDRSQLHRSEDNASPPLSQGEGRGEGQASGRPAARSGPPAKVRITAGPQGLIITSDDPSMLDQLEDLVTQVMPSRAGYKVFTLLHVYAKDVVYLLKDIYKDETEDSSNKKNDTFDMFYYGYPRNNTKEKSRSTLSKRRPLTFVADPVTNTILVTGADPSQMAEIGKLIEMYDRVEPPDSNSVRRTEMVELKFASPKDVATVVKDVYRDLLSPNDKALVGAAQQPQLPQQQQQNGMNRFEMMMMSYLSDDSEGADRLPRFKGMLSVGVDERTNMLVLSAPQVLLTDVLVMVHKLDEASRPTRPVTQIIKLRDPGSIAEIRQAFPDARAPATPKAETSPSPMPSKAVPGQVQPQPQAPQQPMK